LKTSELIKEKLVRVWKIKGKLYIVEIENKLKIEDIFRILTEPKLEIRNYAFHKAIKSIESRLNPEDFKFFLLNLKMMLTSQKMKFLNLWFSKSKNMRWGKDIFY